MNHFSELNTDNLQFILSLAGNHYSLLVCKQWNQVSEMLFGDFIGANGSGSNVSGSSNAVNRLPNAARTSKVLTLKAYHPIAYRFLGINKENIISHFYDQFIDFHDYPDLNNIRDIISTTIIYPHARNIITSFQASPSFTEDKEYYFDDKRSINSNDIHNALMKILNPRMNIPFIPAMGVGLICTDKDLNQFPIAEDCDEKLFLLFRLLSNRVAPSPLLPGALMRLLRACPISTRIGILYHKPANRLRKLFGFNKDEIINFLLTAFEGNEIDVIGAYDYYPTAGLLCNGYYCIQEAEIDEFINIYRSIISAS